MTHNHGFLDAEVLPIDQRRAAELPEAALHGDAERFSDLLAELVAAGPIRALAVVGVLSRNLVATLIAAHGRDGALRILESTRLDAAVAE